MLRSAEKIIELATKELDNRLWFNLRAYGKVWTQEYEDSAFLFPAQLIRDELAERDKEIEALRATIAASPDQQVIVCVQRLTAAADGARAERDIMRAAIEEIAHGRPCIARERARKALTEDRRRREANMAALMAPAATPEGGGDRG